jgi:Fe-S oxidoreductase
VVLWPDTFTNYFHPDIAQAAVEVLERAGFDVVVPRQSVCCGRPLYDFGMLDRAREYLLNVIAVVENEFGPGAPIVVLEPSCASVFRDELRNLLPDDKRAEQLSRRTFLLAEFLEKFAPDFSPPRLRTPRKALVHGHCHQKAVLSMDPELKWLKKIGVEPELLDSGCCGMAGSFGFEKEKYDVSVKCGEHALLPKVREAEVNTLIVANGFSCQEQIRQLTSRRALHLGQVMQLALRPELETGPCPEAAWVQRRESEVARSMRRSGLALVGAAALGTAIWAANRRSA